MLPSLTLPGDRFRRSPRLEAVLLADAARERARAVRDLLIALLAIAVEDFKEAGMVAIPIWRMAHDAGASLAGAARRLGVDAVLLGTSQRGAV